MAKLVETQEVCRTCFGTKSKKRLSALTLSRQCSTPQRAESTGRRADD